MYSVLVGRSLFLCYEYNQRIVGQLSIQLLFVTLPYMRIRLGNIAACLIYMQNYVLWSDAERSKKLLYYFVFLWKVYICML